MKSKINFNLLTKKAFVLGLIVLVINDNYLKFEFPNLITGKLSDFAGLFIFPYFVSIFIEKHSLKIYLATAIFFTFWKLEISEKFINSISNITNLAFHRTVDISDLIALTVLPLSFRYFNKMQQTKAEPKILNYDLIIGVFSFFAIVSSSLPKESNEVHFVTNKEYHIPTSKKLLLDKYGPELDLEIFSEDYIHFRIPENNATVIAKVRIIEINANNSLINLIGINEYTVSGGVFFGVKKSDVEECKKMKVQDFEKSFEKNCIEIIKEKIAK